MCCSWGGSQLVEKGAGQVRRAVYADGPILGARLCPAASAGAQELPEAAGLAQTLGKLVIGKGHTAVNQYAVNG